METKMLNIKINGADYTVPYGITVLEACKQAGIDIPTLCYLKDVNEIGACRLCLVEVVGARGLVTSCVYPIERDGTEILTNTEKVKNARKMNIQLVLSAHERSAFPVSVPRPVSFRSMLTISELMKTISQLQRKKSFLLICPEHLLSATPISVSSAAVA